jgi:radical SAM superfamily enzyme
MVEYIMKEEISGHFMQNAGFDVSFRDCPAKGGTGGHPRCWYCTHLQVHTASQSRRPQSINRIMNNELRRIVKK